MPPSESLPSTWVLGLFAKWPAPGAVKTRLGADPDRSAAVARAFLLDSLTRYASVAVRRCLAFAPAEAEADFATVSAARYDLVAQGGGDLGERLQRFAHDRFRGGADRVVLLGTDSPTLPIDFVQRAFTALDSADVVLGPALDGGYYLIGLKSGHAPVFADIPWSSNGVLAATVAKLRPSDRLFLLPPWYDVDTPDDWALLRGHVAGLRRAGVDPGVPCTEALLHEETE